MNKKQVDSLIPEAYLMLRDAGIAENGKIDKTRRGQISSFGAAVTTGSLLAAVSFFSVQESRGVPRRQLMDAIFRLIDHKNGSTDLFDYVVKSRQAGKEQIAKEEIINRAIALKLAMNLYELV